MGCSTSKIQDDDGVSRCRQRKRSVKKAVKSRNAFAMSFADYVQALKFMGVAFQKYTEGECRDQLPVPATPSTPQPSSSSSPSPPPSLLRRGGSPSQYLLGQTSGTRRMPLITRPSSPVTVVVSPPRSAKGKTKEEEDAYQKYLYDDAPPPEVIYNEQSISYKDYIVPPASVSPPPPPPPSSSTSDWDIFEIFRPAMPMHFHRPGHLFSASEIIHEDEEELKQVFEDEGIPPLEVMSPPTDDLKVRVMEMREPQKKEKGIEEPSTSSKGKDNVQLDHVEISSFREISSPSRESVKEQKANVESVKVEKELKVVVPQRKEREVVDALKVIEEQFFIAYERGRDVARLLEATKAHQTGFSNRSARLLRAVSRSQWSPSTPLSWMSEESSNEDGSTLSHAATLDKLYAWEKKLYAEVKKIEAIGLDSQRKRRLLKRQDTRGVSLDLIDKTRASIKALETQMTVALETMEATSVSIQALTNDELYPELVELLEGFTNMWKDMLSCHEYQRMAVLEMKIYENAVLEATSASHRQATKQLLSALTSWRTSFSDLIKYQREYMRHLCTWLQLSIFKPSGDSRGKHGAHFKKSSPAIFALCRQWQQILNNLPEKVVIDAIKSFMDVVSDIVRQQNEEFHIQKNAESLAKDLNKKILYLNQLERKYVEPASVRENSENNSQMLSTKGSLGEKRASLEEFKKKVEEEKENFTRAIQRTRTLTIKHLQNDLPCLFDGLSMFFSSSVQVYQDLQSKTRTGQLESSDAVQ